MLKTNRKSLIFLFSLLTLILASTELTHGAREIQQPIDQVGLYDVFETRVVNTKDYSNPFDFNVIELQATFTSPSARQINFFGFYDGDGKGGQNGNVWKLRFMPDEVGSWVYTYTWTDGTPGGSGSFQVIDSPNKGPLKIDPLHPHHIIYAKGDHFFWNGDTEWFFLSDIFSQQERLDAIDFLTTKNVNNLLMTMVNDDSYDIYPWVGTANSLDRTRFNLSRMQTWEEIIERMKDEG